jgi:hypothetical protein
MTLAARHERILAANIVKTVSLHTRRYITSDLRRTLSFRAGLGPAADTLSFANTLYLAARAIEPFQSYACPNRGRHGGLVHQLLDTRRTGRLIRHARDEKACFGEDTWFRQRYWRL